MKAEREVDQEARRVLPRLAQSRTVLAATGAKEHGVFTARNGWRRAVVRTASEFVREFLSRELIVPAAADHPGALAGQGERYELSPVGRSYLERAVAAADPFARQHRVMGVRQVEVARGQKRSLQVNQAETPLGWLRSRKGPDGQAFITEPEFEAGERLREDFTKAGLTAKVTADWSFAPGTAPKRRSGAASQLEIADVALAARQRFSKAIEAVGPGLSDILVEVCCHLNGLEEAERGLGWPRRAGKLVLKIALHRLAEHYGLIPAERRSGRVRAWRG